MCILTELKGVLIIMECIGMSHLILYKNGLMKFLRLGKLDIGMFGNI